MKILKLKVELYHELLKKPTQELTENDLFLAIVLGKDREIQEILGKNRRRQ